jgi:hypothetical protein
VTNGRTPSADPANRRIASAADDCGQALEGTPQNNTLKLTSAGHGVEALRDTTPRRQRSQLNVVFGRPTAEQ